MLVAGLSAIFAVSLLFFSLFVTGESGRGGVRENRGLFKTGNPTFRGKASTQGLRQGHVDVPATLEGGRRGVEPSPT